MTVTQAAAVLGIDVATVRRHIKRGLLRFEEVNKRLYLIPDEDVEKLKAAPRLKRGPKPKRPDTPTDTVSGPQRS